MVKSPRARGKQPPRPRQPAQPNAISSDTNSDEPVSPVSANGAASASSRLPFSSGPVLPYLEPPTGFMTLHPSARPLKGKQRAEAESEVSSITERDNPNLSVATPGGGGSRRLDLTFYTNGERASSETASGFPKEYVDLIFASMYKFCPTLVPTTYEAAAEYLREEKMKPKGSRDLRREFCYLSFTKIQESIGKATLFLVETQTLIAVAPGHSLAVPTIDCPPWAFDRIRNTEPTVMLFDPATRAPLDATAVMTYFTNTDPNQKHAFNEEETNIIQYKGKMYE